MTEKKCKGCFASVPGNRRRCPKCGLQTGVVGSRMIFLAATALVVAVFLVQDHLDRPNSWARMPLRAGRERPAAPEQTRPTPVPRREPRRAAEPARPTPMRAAPGETPPAAAVAPASVPARAEEMESSAPQPSSAEPVSPETKWAAEFKPPAVGSTVTVRLRGGDDMKGTLLALDENRLELETPKLTISLSPAQLAAATRVRFFLADYLRYREMRAERERRAAQARAAAAPPPKRDAPSEQKVEDDPFARESETEPSHTPPSGRSEAADAFFRAF